MDKKTLSLRVLLIVVCFCVGCICFYQINRSYDPLARYPYVTEENRDIILEKLDSEDIDYLITQQIKPETFLPFIDEPDFDLHNAYLYSAAKSVQDASNDYIVNFVNKYRQNFSRDILVTLFKHYTYVDLTTFYENEAIFNENLELVSDPSLPYVILNENSTVYKYVPSDLVSVSSVSVRSEVASNLQSMIQDFASVMNNEVSLDLAQGYLSYEAIMEEYVQLNNRIPDQINDYMLPAGQNEFQLGFTIGLQEMDEWINLCIENNVYVTRDYSTVLENLSDTARLKMDWLRENAYRYGFVIRYPEGKESTTNQLYQPFVLRYVGEQTARQMHDKDVCMEEMTFEEELN